MSDNPRTVKAEFIAAVLGVTQRQINRLTQDGVVVKTSRGKYDLPASIVNYFKPRTQAPDINAARLKNLELDNERKELELDEQYGLVHSVQMCQVNREVIVAGVAKILEAMDDNVVRQDPAISEAALNEFRKHRDTAQDMITRLLENGGDDTDEE